MKDHLGSNRLVVDGNGNIEEVNHYYPFGALMGDRCGVSRNNYKYIGKELDTMYGWNMQDHEARWYDPVVGRWHSIDRLAEKTYNVSPYVSCDDNPVRYIDLDGKKKHNWIENDKKNSRYNNASYQKRFINNGIIQIWAHGLKTQNIEGPAFAIGVSVDRYTHKRFGEGYYHNLSHDKNQIKMLSNWHPICINMIKNGEKGGVLLLLYYILVLLQNWQRNSQNLPNLEMLFLSLLTII